MHNEMVEEGKIELEQCRQTKIVASEHLVEGTAFYCSRHLLAAGMDHGVLTGDALVLRNPCYLPSDAQRVKFVYCQHLYESVQEVIVFSARGNVPLANLLANGDYDGDTAVVIWDQRIVQAASPVLPPPSSKERPPWAAESKLGTTAIEALPVQTMRGDGDDRVALYGGSAVAKAVCEYTWAQTKRSGAAVGVLSTLHRCWANREPEGARSDKCIRLAQRISRALDAFKQAEFVDKEVDSDLVLSPREKEEAKALKCLATRDTLESLPVKVRFKELDDIRSREPDPDVAEHWRSEWRQAQDHLEIARGGVATRNGHGGEGSGADDSVEAMRALVLAEERYNKLAEIQRTLLSLCRRWKDNWKGVGGATRDEHAKAQAEIIKHEAKEYLHSLSEECRHLAASYLYVESRPEEKQPQCPHFAFEVAEPWLCWLKATAASGRVGAVACSATVSRLQYFEGAR
mmetsp:Transcript_34544/g.80768  ORF Transcript_34544/g.80768 Transcript_34544/m.80768 type:complete len:459 (+) Transcript_34544:818-2194(+)